MKRSLTLIALTLVLAGCQSQSAAGPTPAIGEPTPAEGIPLPERTEETSPLPPPATDTPDPGGSGGGGVPGSGSNRFLLVDAGGRLWSGPVTGESPAIISADDRHLFLPGSETIAIHGSLMAYLNQPAGADGWDGLSLTMADTAGGVPLTTVSLLPAGYDHQAVTSDPAQFPAYAGLLAAGNMAWSPDGNQIAFAAMTEGTPTAIYTLDTASLTSLRLTATPGFAYLPTWSPDGSTLLLIEASSFSADTLAPVDRSLMALHVADNALTRLEEMPGEGYDGWLGWLDDSTAIAYSADSCGLRDLRAVDVNAKTVSSLFAGRFTSADFDPVSRTILVGVSDFPPACDDVSSPALYRIPAGGEPEQVIAIRGLTIGWEPGLNAFTVVSSITDGIVLLVTAEGQVSELPGGYAAQVDAAATGRIAWLSPDGTLSVGDKSGPRVQIAETVLEFSWSPDGQYLAVMLPDGIYLATGPDYQLTPFGLGPDFSGAFGGTWAD